MRLDRPPLAKAAILLAALIMTTPASSAQQPRDKATVSTRYDPAGDPLIITLKADPGVAYLTQDVHLIGGTVGAGQFKSVRVVVTPPVNAGEAPKPTLLTAPLDGDGDFNVIFKDTVRGGTYTAVATAPDGRGVAKTTFDIYAGNDLKAPQVVADIQRNANTILDIVAAKVDALPPSPAKEKFKGKVKDLRRKVDGPPPPMDKIPPLIQAGGPPDGPERLMKSFDRGKQLATRSAEEIKRLNAKQTTCDDLEVITEGLKWVSFMWNFLAKDLLETSANLATESLGVLSSKMAAKAGAPAEWSFLVGEGVRQNQGIINKKVSINNALGELTNLLAADAEILMNAYCQVFTGPVTGAMKASFTDANTAAEWWNYNYKIIGRLVLHYPKNATGPKVGLKGHIEGYAYDFHVWENALSVLYPKLMSGTVQVKRVFPPFDMGNELSTALTDYDEGSVAGALAPNSFFIAVDGEVTKDEMSIRLGPARTDIDAKARVLAITLSPLTMALLPTAYELPYKEVRFLVERAFEGDVVVLPLKTTADTMSVEKQFKARRGGLEASGEYTLNVKSCNPACAQPSPKQNKAQK